jgi:hypothetical protein
MTDATTGRTFYVDHVNKVTTWVRPVIMSGGSGQSAPPPPASASASASAPSSGNTGPRSGFGFNLPDTSSSSVAAPPGGSNANNNQRSSQSYRGASASSATNRNSYGSDYGDYGGGDYGNSTGGGHYDDYYGGGNDGGGGGASSPLASAHHLSHTTVPDSSSQNYYALPSNMTHSSVSAFTTVHVPDSLRTQCPSCNNVFSLTLRRHHCRLCGDVYCDACSNNRVELPLEGEEYRRAVRVCDLCLEDVERGNYFSLRRYLTPLVLYDPSAAGANLSASMHGGGGGSIYDGFETSEDGEKTHAITASQVSAALAALAADFDSYLMDSTTISSKLTISPDVLVPAICRHLCHSNDGSSAAEGIVDQAARALSSLLSLGNVSGDGMWARTVFSQDGNADVSITGKEVLDSILKLLEWSGTAARTLAVQEQAMRSIFYLTDTSTIKGLYTSSKEEGGMGFGSGVGGQIYDAGGLLDDETAGGRPDDDMSERDIAWRLDTHRTLRACLDHTTTSSSPSLQRWAAAAIRNLIAEDRRRACGAIAACASQGGGALLKYDSFTNSSLVETGGVMILSSLISSDDADTRAHAIAALSATIATTRGVQASLDMLSEVTGAGAAPSTTSDANVVRSVLQGGGLGPSLAQLLLSADDSVAKMGLAFAASLVGPILDNPKGTTGSVRPAVSAGTLFDDDEDGMEAYREAALNLCTSGGVLPSLLSLLRSGRGSSHGSLNPSRPMELRKTAMLVLAAVSQALRYLGGQWVFDYIEKNHRGVMGLPDDLPTETAEKVLRAISNFEKEGVAELAYSTVLQSGSSLGGSGSRDSPGSHLAEAASVILSGMAQISPATIDYLARENAVMQMLRTCGENSGMMKPSSLRGDWCPRSLGLLQVISSVVDKIWKFSRRNQSEDLTDSTSPAVDLLVSLLDAGSAPLLARIVATKIEYHVQSKAVGTILLKVAACEIVASMFGIVRDDASGIAGGRLYTAIDDAGGGGYGGRQRQDLTTGCISLLQSTSVHMQRYGGGDIPLPALSRACLLAVGSICGAAIFGGQVFKASDFAIPPEDEFTSRRRDACVAVCAFMMGTDSSAALPSMLVGSYGEESVLPAMRLALALVQNGPMNVHAQVGQSGILIPITDILKNALIEGERYPFSASISLVRFCGPHVSTSGTKDSASLASIRDAVRTISSVLLIEESADGEEEQVETLKQLKTESIFALEALSTNTSLWAAISQHSVPAVSQYLLDYDTWHEDDAPRQAVLCAALRVIQRIIPLPSHAVAAARAGLGTSLAKVITGKIDKNDPNDKSSASDRRRALIRERERREQKVGPGSDDDVQKIALEVLHTLASQGAARRGDEKGSLGLYHCGAVGAVCYLLSSRATAPDESAGPASPAQQGAALGSQETIAKLGLEFLLYLLADLETPLPPNDPYNGAENQRSEALAFVDVVGRKVRFIRCLVATMLQTEIGLNITGSNGNKEKEESSTFVVAPLYGPPLILFEGSCGGFPDPQQAAVSVLFSIASLCCTNRESKQSETFWETFLMREERSLVRKETQQATAVAACALFLNILMDEEGGICVPRDSIRETYYIDASLPLVRKKLLEGLLMSISGAFETLAESEDITSTAPLLSLLRQFHVPETCLALCASPGLIEPASQIVERSMELYSEELIPSVVTDKNSLRALFDSLNRRIGGAETKRASTQIRRLNCQILSHAADQGTLGPAVDRLGLRTQAVAALTAACLVDGEDPGAQSFDDDDLVDIDVPLLCLRSLIAVFSVPPKNSDSLANGGGDHRLYLSSAEATAVASTLGRKISEMVLARFQRHHDGDDDSIDSEDEAGHKSITDAPEIRLLCALASNKEALPDLCKNNGLQALSLVATEGDLSAIEAMHEACKDDPSVILQVEGHVSVMNVLVNTPGQKQNQGKVAVDTACLEILATLCGETEQGRLAVADADECTLCISYAIECIQGGCSDGDEATGQGSEDNADEEKEEKSENDVPAVVVTTPSIQDDRGQRKLQLAAFSFLAELVRVEKHRSSFFSMQDLLESSSKLVSRSEPTELQYSAIKFLSALAPYATSSSTELFPVAKLASVFSLRISLEGSKSKKIKRSGFVTTMKASRRQISSDQLDVSENYIVALAVSGLKCLLHSLPNEEQIEIAKLLSSQLIRLIDAASFSAKNKFRSDRGPHEQSGMLAYNTMELLLALNQSPSCRDAVLDESLLSVILRLIVLSDLIEGRKDDVDDDELYWDATVTECLQYISLVSTSRDSEISLGKSWSDLLSEVETAAGEVRHKKTGAGSGRTFSMMSRSNSGVDGDMNSTPTTFRGALIRIMEKRSNSLSVVAARSILKQL